MLPHHIEFTHAIGRLGQSCRLFCPVGQMYQGFENPRLFKDRPTDGNPAAAPHPSIYQRVQQRMQPCVGMPTFFNNLQQHGATHYFASAMVAQAPAATLAPIYARIDFRRQLQPRPQPHRPQPAYPIRRHSPLITATLAAPPEEQSRNSWEV